MRSPRTGKEDLVVERGSREFPQNCAGVEFVRCDRRILAGVDRPYVLVILRNERAERRLVMPRNSPALQNLARARAEMNHLELSNPRRAIERDIEQLANAAAAAVAADQVIAANGLGPIVFGIPQGCRDPGLILFEIVKRPSEPHAGARLGLRRGFQNRFDLDLRDAHSGLARLSAVVGLADQPAGLFRTGIAKAMQLVPGQ